MANFAWAVSYPKYTVVANYEIAYSSHRCKSTTNRGPRVNALTFSASSASDGKWAAPPPKLYVTMAEVECTSKSPTRGATSTSLKSYLKMAEVWWHSYQASMGGASPLQRTSEDPTLFDPSLERGGMIGETEDTGGGLLWVSPPPQSSRRISEIDNFF
jgi:hypothetical protein